jgi:hypothetical protein
LNDEAGKPPRKIIKRGKWAATATKLLLAASFECELARQHD